MDTTTTTTNPELIGELLEVLMIRHDKVTNAVRMMAFEAPGRQFTPEEERRIKRAQQALIRYNDILDSYFDKLEQRYDQHNFYTDSARL